MSIIEEMRAKAREAAASQQSQTNVVANVTTTASAAPAVAPTINPAEELVPQNGDIVMFFHPIAGSTAIMPNGEVMTFEGAIEGTGDKRRVGYGLIETDDPDKIKFLRECAANPSNMVQEVRINKLGQFVGQTQKKEDKSIKRAVAAAAGNATNAAAIGEADAKFAGAVKTGAAKDVAAGQTLQPDTTLQTAMAAAAAAGDQRKEGTVHNAQNA